MSAPSVQQPNINAGSLLKSGDLGVLYWLKADGTVALVNDTTPLPVTATLSSSPAGFPGAAVDATNAPTRFVNLGANATLNIKASAGQVFSLTCHNENAAERYIQLHNSATTSSGAPLFSFLVPALSQIVIGTDFFTAFGAYFSTGIAFGFSTTKDTYTAGTAGDHSTWVMYK